MLKKLGDVYAGLLGWPALARIHRALFYLSARGLGLYNYSNPGISGERWVIRNRLRRLGHAVVFDIGANNGEWLADVLRANAAARIHAFEPQRALAAQIRIRHPNVTVTVAAVGAEPGHLDLFDYADHPGSQHASLVAGVIDQVHGAAVRSSQVRVLTLDDYCSEHGILHIDLLKIDVEGFELQVLKGAERMLNEGRIEAIQFEFTQLNVVGRVFLDDFFRVLGDRYKLYRLLPHGLMRIVAKDHWRNEQFIYQNLLACKAVMPDFLPASTGLSAHSGPGGRA